MRFLNVALVTLMTLPASPLAVLQPKARSVPNELCPSDGLFQVKRESCPADLTFPLAAPDEPRVTTHTCTDRYCVYTDAHYWAGRGIAFVTTADAMDTAIMQGLRQYYRPEFVSNVAVNAFDEHEIAGKGVGLVARRFLRKGELIILEPPSLLVHLGMRTTLSEERRLEMQRAAVDALPPRARLETLGLMGQGQGDRIEDILDTNSFTVTLGKSRDHHALFTQTSVGFRLRVAVDERY